MSEGYLAIIPARSGSKRLPGKNIRNLCGKPLFVWSILAGLANSHISRVVVSTDSENYQKLAVQAGAYCPWLRDVTLADDNSTSADVVLDVLERLGDGIQQYRGLILLQPTSPLRSSEDITGALHLFETSQAPAIVSVSQAECPPMWMGKIASDFSMDDFIRPEFSNIRSQDLGAWYRINGAIYIIDIDEFLVNPEFIPTGSIAYVMPRERSVDVDTDFDFRFAEFLMESL